ncbi:prophage tail fiber N-terminal domain-containing protein [Pectobacterium versatile]|uniref:phage tail fiber protein n=1 Tax=Pectobacterium versatile TaxID=2488639 RepID=UPI001BB2D684|nr:prophage tail fiber N-terminal domain-containing protein [Pectobacterium versatile]
MSVLISGVLMNPAGVPVSGAEVTFSALTNGPSVLNGFSASVMTDQDGNYAIPLEICEYAISIQSDGYNSVYGSVSINEKSAPATINELLKLAAMEQAVTPAIIVYFREIQTDVAAKLATMQTLNNSATTAMRDAITARNEAAQYAQSLSAAVAQAQQASTSATASANAASNSANGALVAKNGAETAAGNAQATLAGAMKKSANGTDISDPAAFRANVGLGSAATHDAQTSPTDNTPYKVLSFQNNSAGPFGLGSSGTLLSTSDVVIQLRASSNGFYRCPANTARAPSSAAWSFLVMRWDGNTAGVIAFSTASGGGLQLITIGTTTDSGWAPLWGSSNLALPLSTPNGGAGKSSGAFANGPNYQGSRPLAEFLSSADSYGNNSAGSVSINDDGGTWHTYLNIKHRSGIDDGIDYGFMLEDRSMTSSDYNAFSLRKRVGAGWLPYVTLWHSGNLSKQSNTFDATAGAVMINGAWGWGAPAPDTAAFNVATTSELVQLLRTSPPGVYRNKLSEQAWWPGLLTRTSDTFMYIRAGHVANSGEARTSGVKILTGSNSVSGEYNLWTDKNLANPMTTDTTQTISGEKTFSNGIVDNKSNFGRAISSPPVNLTSVSQLNNMRIGDILFVRASESLAALVPETTGFWHIRCLSKSDISVGTGSFEANLQGTSYNVYTGALANGSAITWRRSLYAGYNAVADSGGFWKTASPVINIYADGSFTTTDEAAGVNVERLEEGVYKITGCQGMHPDAAWNGIDGGVSNPKCRNGQELTWNNYEVDEDGSVTVYTFHRVHPEAMPFAQNRLTLDKEPFDERKGHKLEDTWPDQTPIDVPKGTFIQVRVNMPERAEPKLSVMHSNVYCNNVSLV